MGDGTLLIVVILVLLALNFLPTIIAASKSHPRVLPIFVVNLFFGWTLVGWVLALVWALSPPLDQQKRNA